MKKLSEVITLVTGLNENTRLTHSMLDYAESDSDNEVTIDRYDIPVTEFHQYEGIYEMKISSNIAVENQLRNIKSEADGLRFRTTSDATELQDELKFLAGLTVEEVANRKTKDGQKLWKKISKTMKNIEKLFHTGFPYAFEILEHNFISQNVMMKGEAEIFKSGTRNANESIWIGYVWLRDLKNEVKRLEKLDQQNKTAMINETIYARLSFRRQDVLGMTHLGNYSSCQNLNYGFSDHATSLAGSLLSPDLGTLTLHQTLESATIRDEIFSQSTIFTNTSLQAVARDNIIKDDYGNIIPNGRHYYDETKYRAYLEVVTQLFTEMGIFKEDLTGTPDLYNDNYETSRSYELEADIMFSVSGNIYASDVFSQMICDHDLDEDAQSVLESDELTLDEKLDCIENLGLLDEVLEYMASELSEVELPEWSYDMPVRDDDYREITVSDDDIMNEVDTDEIREMAIDQANYIWGRYEIADALECGCMTYYVGYNVTMDYEDEDSDIWLAPYCEGEISRWV